MASWSTKRKYGYLLGVIALGVLLVGVPAFYVFYTPPTCFDGKQNGGERGVDCGGSCVKLCLADFAMPRVLWSYSQRIVPGVYNSLAYVQNPNPAAETFLSYLFKLYDSEGILVTQRAGSAFIPAGQRLAIFEGTLRTGERIPARTTFEFTSEPDWRGGVPFTDMKTLSIDLTQGNSPSAEVRVQNSSPRASYKNVNAYIVLFNKDDNRLAFSKTVIPQIAPTETQTLYFTWPEAFSENVVRSEMLFVRSQ